MKWLIITGDDFGMSSGINLGIIEAHHCGILSSEGGRRVARECPVLSLGLHLELATDDPERVHAQIEQQVARFLELVGALPTHLDSHHNVHHEPQVLPHVLAWARRSAVPVRGHSEIRHVSKFYGQWGGDTHLEQIGVEGLLAITGRATFLSFFFGILTLLLTTSSDPLKIALGLFCFAMALLSKEESVIVPLLAGLLWTIRPTPRRPYRVLVPLFALLGVYLMYRHSLFGSLGAPSNHLYTAQFYVQAFPRVLTHYVALILIPWNLHSHRLILRLSHVWYLSLAGWMALGVFSYRKRQERPWLYFSVFWFVISLLPPSLAMVYGGFILDHWGYWAAPAVFLPLGLLFDELWTRRQETRYRKLGALFFPVIVCYALLTRLNIELRNTDEKMYRWALHFTTSNPIQYNLGVLLLESGRAGEAIPYFLSVRSNYPDDLNNLHALALAYWKTGHPKIAIRLLQSVLKTHPDFQPAVQSLHMMQSTNAPKAAASASN